MSEARSVPEAIQWTEGMLLSPQHFQQMDLHTQAKMHFHLRHTMPWFWGVTHLEFDPVGLASLCLRINELDAIMPDGTLVQYRIADRAPEEPLIEISLAGKIDEHSRDPLPIWIGIPYLNPISSWTSGEHPRFLSVNDHGVRDLNMGEDQVHLARLRPVLSLFDERPPGIFSSFPVANLVWENKGLAVSRSFEPPSPSLGDDSHILEMCRTLNAVLRRKASHQQSVAQKRSWAELSMQLEMRLALHAMVSALPYFETVVKSKSPHPHELYLALAHLSGHLATLSRNAAPEPLPDYDHNNLYPIFKKICTRLTNILESSVAEDFTGMRFRFEDEHYSLHFREDWVERTLIVAMEPGRLSKRDAESWMSGCIIGLRSDEQDLRVRRVAGLARRLLTKAPPGLVAPEGSLLFEVESVEPIVKSTEELVIWPVSSFTENAAKPNLVLYVRDV